MHIAYRVSYLVFFATGHLAASLAGFFRSLTVSSRRWGALVLPLQVSVFVAWCPVRAVSLASFALCQALAPRLV
jgi:hypothetical protein